MPSRKCLICYIWQSWLKMFHNFHQGESNPDIQHHNNYVSKSIRDEEIKGCNIHIYKMETFEIPYRANKNNFFVAKITRAQALDILQFHYLSKQGLRVRTGLNYGLFYKSLLHQNDKLIGCCLIVNPSGSNVVQGMIQDSSDVTVRELGRLVLHPCVKTVNILTWFVSRVFREIRKNKICDVLLSYADASIHSGKIYQSLSMPYYGLTTRKSDFYFADGRRHTRGAVKGQPGCWKPRTQKHRYLKVFNPKVLIKWKQLPYPADLNNQVFNREPITLTS